MRIPFANRVPPSARAAYCKDTIAGMLSAVAFGLTAPFAAVIARKELHASAFEIGILSMAPVAGNLFSLIWANMMEGHRKMPYALWSWVASRFLFVMVIFAVNSWSFVIIISAMYFISSIAGSAYSVLMKEIYPDSERMSIMAYARVCTIATFVIVTAVASPLVTGDHYRYVFPVAGVFGIVSSFVFASIPTKLREGKRGVPFLTFMRSSFLILREDRGYAWFCAAVSICGFASYLALPIMTIHQVDIGVDTDWAGVYSIVSALIMTVAFFYWGGYTDRHRPEGVVALQSGVFALVPIIYCFAGRPWMLLPAMLVQGVVSAGMELSYFTGVLHFAPEGKITQYQAVFLSLMGFRGIVGPFIGAAFYQSHLMSARGIFVLSAVMILSSVFVQLAGMRRHGRRGAQS